MYTIDIKEVLRGCGCIHTGDYFFAFKSGRVSQTYICIDPLLTFPIYLNAVASMLTRTSKGFSVIAGPAVGALPLIYASAGAVAHHFDNEGLRTVFVEKEADGFILNRMGFASAVSGKKVLIVEDIGSTGASAKATGAAIEAAGGTVVGYRFIWNRDPGRINEEKMGAPVFSLVEEAIESFAPDEHPMWGIWPLVTDVGHPEKFPDYPGPRLKVL